MDKVLHALDQRDLKALEAAIELITDDDMESDEPLVKATALDLIREALTLRTRLARPLPPRSQVPLVRTPRS